MLPRRERRQLRSWLAKRHDPRSSWELCRADAERNDGAIPPLAEAQRILWAIRRAAVAVLDASGRLGIEAEPMSLCAVLATVGARMATELTGNVYRPQSGKWYRVAAVEGGRVQWWERTGSGQDFHAWAVAAHPGGKLAMLDPQAMFWEPPTVVWDWADEVFRTGVVWRAHTATTAKVVELADAHAHICEALYSVAMDDLDSQAVA